MRTVAAVVMALVSSACGRIAFDAGTDEVVTPFAPPELAWSHVVGGSSSQALAAVAATPDGGVVVTGHTTGPIDLGGGMLPHAGGEDVLLASFDADGNHRWSRTFGTPLDDNGFDLAADKHGNIYVSGEVLGPVDFGGGLVGAYGGVDMFIASFAADGSYRWGHIWGSPNNGEIIFGLATGTNRIYATGWFMGPIDFGDGLQTSIEDQDVVLLAFDLDGNISYSRAFGGLVLNQGQKIAVGGDGSLAITGIFNGTSDLGDGVVTSAGSHDAFLVRLDPDGAPRWSTTTGGIEADRGTGVAIGPMLETYRCGEYRATVDFGTGAMTAANADGFVVKHGDGPTPEWVRTITGTTDEGFDSCMAMQDGRVVLAGKIGTDGALIEGTPVVSVGMRDAFLAAFDPDGDLAWVRHYGSPGVENIRDIAAGPDGVIYATGNFSDPIDFGDGLHTPTGTDGLLLRLVPGSDPN